jgi:hypothetical protein
LLLAAATFAAALAAVAAAAALGNARELKGRLNTSLADLACGFAAAAGLLAALVLAAAAAAAAGWVLPDGLRLGGGLLLCSWPAAAAADSLDALCACKPTPQDCDIHE